MDVIGKFRREHDVFRIQLGELEAALERGVDTWRAWRDIGFVLSYQLRAHIRREEETIAACARRLGTIDAGTLEAFAMDHDQDLRFLQCVNRQLAGVIYRPDAQVRGTLTDFVVTFRMGMEQQQAELFPVIHRVFGPQRLAAVARRVVERY